MGRKKVPVKKQALRMASDAAVRASKNNKKHQPFLPIKTVIEADAEKADDGDTDLLSRYYLYSTLEYADGEWLVVDEYMQREDY